MLALIAHLPIFPSGTGVGRLHNCHDSMQRRTELDIDVAPWACVDRP